MKWLVPALAVGALGCIGAGLWFWVHPGAGVLAVGLLIWIDLALKASEMRTPGARRQRRK